MFSGIAAQLIAINGLSLRGELSCKNRARTSLPVPLSPVINTVASVSATRRDRLNKSLELLSTATIFSELGAVRI